MEGIEVKEGFGKREKAKKEKTTYLADFKSTMWRRALKEVPSPLQGIANVILFA